MQEKNIPSSKLNSQFALHTPKSIERFIALESGRILFPLLAWGTAYSAFNTTRIKPRCTLLTLDDCRAYALTPWDHIAVAGPERHVYKWASDILQNGSGIFCLLLALIIIWQVANKRGRLFWMVSFFLCLLWNGAINAIVRLAVQRPRPFAFDANPTETLFLSPSTFTSFYSGHTSFVALAWTYLGWAVYLRTQKTALVFGVASLGALMTGLTALFRIQGGMHYLTDTLVGAAAGCLIANIVLLIRHRQEKIQKLS